MESDGRIVTELPQIMNETVRAAGAEVLTAGPWDWVYTLVYILISILLFSVIIYIAFRCIKHFRVKNKVALLLKENKATKEASAARIEGRIGTRKDTEIISLPWHELTSRLKSGSLTASSALKAYQGLALEVDMKTNSVVCWVEDAEDQARMLDSIPAGERGPLHGVPVSVKECYDIAGTYSSAGMAMFARNKAEVDSPVVELVKKLGGVPFCKTNVPQVMYSLQCSNPIYGTSTNPYGVGRECGGSSGGEGALIGGGGSILGLGSDIGGSLRNPAAFCGCYSLKPSAGRHLSQLGVVAGTGPSPVGISVVGGFMGQSAAAVEASWKAVWRLENDQNCQMVDTGVLPMSWNQKLYDKKPRIGYFTTDGMIDPTPGCVRAVTEALDRLKKAGFETVEIPSPDIYEVMVHFNGIVLAELNSGLYKNMSNDIYDSTLSGVVAAVTVYKFPWIIKKLIINPIMSFLTRIPPVVTVYNNATKLAAGLSARDQFTRDYLKQMDNLGVDIILCPGQLLPAPPTGVLGMFVAAVSPYIPWNVMNFPAGIAPITKWTTDDDAKMADYPTDDMAYKMIRNYCKEAEGLPLSVQVVGRPYMDEQVLRILSVLEKFA